MTLQQAVEAARIAAMKEHVHVCHCDLTDGSSAERHERAMQAQHSAMAEAVLAVLATWQEPVQVAVNKTARRKKDSA